MSFLCLCTPENYQSLLVPEGEMGNQELQETKNKTRLQNTNHSSSYNKESI
jgi:hypothetical protein